MNFTDKIAADLLRVDFAARTKDEALRQIASIAATSPRTGDIGEEEIYTRLAEREASVSTGIGGEIAIPHARLDGLADFVVFILVAPKGIDFEALDRKRVRIFFVVLAPEEQINEQLKILASISRALSQSNLKKELLSTNTPDILRETIARVSEEDTAPTRPEDRKMKLLYIILYYEDDLHAVLEYLIDRGIDGANIIESKGMGAYVSAMPLFASFLGFMREDRNTSHTVMALIPAREEMSILKGLESITGDLNKKQGAMLMTLDLSFTKGTLSMI